MPSLPSLRGRPERAESGETHRRYAVLLVLALLAASAALGWWIAQVESDGEFAALASLRQNSWIGSSDVPYLVGAWLLTRRFRPFETAFIVPAVVLGMVVVRVVTQVVASPPNVAYVVEWSSLLAVPGLISVVAVAWSFWLARQAVVATAVGAAAVGSAGVALAVASLNDDRDLTAAALAGAVSLGVAWLDRAALRRHPLVALAVVVITAAVAVALFGGPFPRARAPIGG